MPTYEIALCDTEKDYAKKVKTLIEKYTSEFLKGCKVLIYNQPQKLVADIKEKKIAPVMLYIDVELENANGIEVVKKVNKLSKECRVVYLTKYLKYATEVYNTKHFYFVKKGELKDRLPFIFEKFNSEVAEDNQYIGMALKNSKYSFIKIKDILYFERQGRYTNIYSIDGVYKTKNKLDEIENKLSGYGFVRCHNSYIVSLNNIREYQRDRVKIVDHNVPISRQYQVSFRNKFKDYVKAGSISSR